MDIEGTVPSAGATERSMETDGPLTAALSSAGSQRSTSFGEGRLSKLENDLDGLGLTESLTQRTSQSGQTGQEEVVKEMVRHFERISANVEAAVVSSEDGGPIDAPEGATEGKREGRGFLAGRQAEQGLIDENDPLSDDPAWRRREEEVSLERGPDGRVEGIDEDDDEEDEISEIEEAFSKKHRPDLQGDSPQRQPRHKAGSAPRSSSPPHQQLQQLGQTVGEGILGVARDLGFLKGRGGSLRDPAPREDASLLGMPGNTASNPPTDSSAVDGHDGQGPNPSAPGQPGAHGGTGVASSLESLDYEVIENAVYREDQARKGRLDQLGYLALKWIFALLLGIATGLAAFFINVAVEILAGWKFVATSWMMQVRLSVP